MNPIINPIWFYICSVVDAFKQGFAAVGIIFVCTTIVLGIFGPLVIDDMHLFGKEPVDWFFHKWIKRGVPISIIALLIATAIPSEKVCYQMLVASMVTEDNIEYVGDKATDLIDYIIDKVDTAFNEEEAE